MRKVKWGIIGTAMICERDTIPGMLLSNNCELYAIAGRNPEKVESFKTKYGFKKTYLSYDELLDDPEVEAVYNPLPNTMHHEWTIKALNKGKHVLCEKPLAPSAKEAREMFAAAKANNVHLMEAFAYQHSPFVAAIQNEVASGVIGDVELMSLVFLTSDYDISNIRMRRETLGGSLYDLGVYTSSLILRVLGEKPESVKAFAQFSEEKIDKLTTALLEYKDGKKAQFTCGMILETEKNKNRDQFEIVGTKGFIRSQDFGFNVPGLLSYSIHTPEGVMYKTVHCPHNYMLEVEQLGRCITDGEKPHVSEEFSVTQAEIIDMVLNAIGYY